MKTAFRALITLVCFLLSLFIFFSWQELRGEILILGGIILLYFLTFALPRILPLFSSYTQQNQDKNSKHSQRAFRESRMLSISLAIVFSAPFFIQWILSGWEKVQEDLLTRTFGFLAVFSLLMWFSALPSKEN